jgi:hypothetical protein
MLLKELVTSLSHIQESLDGPPLPYKEISAGNVRRYDIELNNTIVRLDIAQRTVMSIKCASILYTNPTALQGKQFDTTNTEQMPIRLFTTITHIVGQLDTDIIFCVADDTNIDIQGKKLNLYKVVIGKLQRQRKIFTWDVLNVDGYDKPVIYAIASTARLSIKQASGDIIAQLAIEFAMEKMR